MRQILDSVMTRAIPERGKRSGRPLATPSMKTTAPSRKINWIPLPDPITEEEVKLVLGDWIADSRDNRSARTPSGPDGV